MAISEKTILDPDQAKPGIPLKRATVFTLMGIFVLLLVGAAMWKAADDGPQQGAQTATVKNENEIKQVPSPAAQLDEEKKAAIEKAGRAQAAAAVPASAASARAASPVPLPAGSASGRAVIPPEGVARADNSGALYANGVRRNRAGVGGGDDADVQVDAAARISKSVVLDEAPSLVEQGTAARDRVVQARTSLQEAPAQTQAPSSSISPQIEALRAQVAGQAQPRPANWLRDYAADTAKEPGVIAMQPALPGYVLRKGKVIPAVIVRKLNSDLPGRITALVRENVYDSSGNLLIPYGSELVGNYDAQIKIGQERVLFAFSDLYLPNGSRFKLPAATGSDMEGAAGVTGDVNNHFFKIFGTSLLIAILADNTKQPSNVSSYGGSAPLTAAGQVLSETSRTILQRNQNIQPTITVDQGTRINVEVVADMLFPGPYSPSKRVMQ